MIPKYAEFIGKEIRRPTLNPIPIWQNILTVMLPTRISGFRIRSIAIRSGQLSTALLNAELEKIEKPAGISNPKDFRNEIVTLRTARQSE
ncbi:hypothetical protein ACLK1T_25665 [Escherichia coli]